MPRRKAEQLPAAQSREEAAKLLGRYAELNGQVEARTARVDDAIAQLRAQADVLNAPAIAEQKVIFSKVSQWWEVVSAELTEGKRKSIELGGCVLGHRTTPPKLAYPAPEPRAAQLLMAVGWKGLLRLKIELDKPAILTALKLLEIGDAKEVTDAKETLARWGFKSTQKEEFFIDRLPPKAETVEIIPAPAQQVAA